MIIAYKIFEVGEKDGKPVPKTLFHGHDPVWVPGAVGRTRKRRPSRTLPLNAWLYAECRNVTDGSRQFPYMSGFHCFLNLDAARAWFNTARRGGRAIVRVLINSQPRVKRGAVRHTVLADYMFIGSQEWRDRIAAEDL